MEVISPEKYSFEVLSDEELARLEEEGKGEQKRITVERDRLYGERIDRSKELPKLAKRIFILDCSTRANGFATKFITLADHRLDLTNADTVPVAADNVAYPNFDECAGIIISGSAANPSEKDEYPWINTVKDYVGKAVEKGIPVMGICFGMQLLADMEGREVPKNVGGIEQGHWKTSIFAKKSELEHPFFKGLNFQTDSTNEFGSALISTLGTHSYSAKKGDNSPHGYSYPAHVFSADSISPELLENPYQYPMIEMRGDRKIFGVQFHPEYSNLLGADYQTTRVKINARKIQGSGQNPLKLLEGLKQYKNELQTGPTNADGSVLLKNFIDICLSEN